MGFSHLLNSFKPVTMVVFTCVLMGCVSGKAITKKEYSQTIDKVITADFMYGEYPQLSSCFTGKTSMLKSSLDKSIDQCREHQLRKISDNEMLSAAAQQNFTKRVTKCGLFGYLKNHKDDYKGNQDGNCKQVARMYRNITQNNVEVF